MSTSLYLVCIPDKVLIHFDLQYGGFHFFNASKRHQMQSLLARPSFFALENAQLDYAEFCQAQNVLPKWFRSSGLKDYVDAILSGTVFPWWHLRHLLQNRFKDKELWLAMKPEGLEELSTLILRDLSLIIDSSWRYFELDCSHYLYSNHE